MGTQGSCSGRIPGPTSPLRDTVLSTASAQGNWPRKPGDSGPDRNIKMSFLGDLDSKLDDS